MENYIVSARKYRPLNFESVVGQKALTQTLQNAIRQNHLAHAYLFCGPRGVGKTTCARIFAKTINCLNPSSGHDACNECESCRAFNEGRSFNIHELDAASNNSVEDIRSLIDQVRIPPQIGKYSVYIIDEVHMLSTGAFNALLKTLEEPPSYAIFILATTEKHKVLPTILSRCQVYDFARITIADTIAHLQHVAQQEGVNASEEALNVVAQKADGGMRDALSIFDQLVSFCGNTITYEQPLSDVTLEGGQAGTISGDIIAGDFMWTNKYLIPNAGEGVKYAITFVPYNQDLYDNVTDSIAIDVLRKAQSIVWSMPDSLGVMDSIALDGRATSNLPVSYALSGSGATYATVGSDHALDITATTAALGTELVITATQAGNQNYLPADDVTFSIVLRKTRANFFAATEPISIPAGSSIALSEIRSRVHTESSVAGTWDFDASAPTALNACIWTLKATFTPANLELCEIITVEIPVNITAE